jgi:hypothetical protein
LNQTAPRDEVIAALTRPPTTVTELLLSTAPFLRWRSVLNAFDPQRIPSPG